MSLSEDESTSDEEYIPPVKASKLEEDSESEYSDESESGDSDCISGKIIPSLDLSLDSLTSQSSKKRPAKRVIQAVSNSNRTKGLGVSHNKTSTETNPLKPKYLERQAFFNRANEREYQYERQLRKSASSRKT
ncbi:unnamed protein product [Schistosoma curassoni]|uniref:BCNT-C domain-containing protein n=1 Tax=Schistosoma curassoni TaxID=6186 RepID=A0A183JBF2_9TREM|nr:unnamed protein product [Schistosoma curassoni]